MTENLTCFVLGAGASMPYGFPSGVELKGAIAGLTASQRMSVRFRSLRDFELARELQKNEFTQDEIKGFGDTLIRSPKYSIDSFLEGRPEFVKIGKTAIAMTIGYCEMKAVDRIGVINEDDWLQYLYNNVGTSVEALVKSKLKFITFNYDRSLEHWLIGAAKIDSGLDGPGAERLVSELGIVHVHGTVGRHEFGVDIKEVPWCKVANEEGGISLVSEESIDQSSLFKSARAYIRRASRICFLGFGYHKENVRRLNIFSKWPANTPSEFCHHDIPAKSVSGSVFNMQEGEIQRVKTYFESGLGRKLNRGDANRKCEDFLRHSAVIANIV